MDYVKVSAIAVVMGANLLCLVQAPLSLSCPAPTVTTLPGQSNAFVTYPYITVTGGTDPIGSVLCNPISGRLFDIGTHIVTCTVTDAASAMDTCRFVVEVIGRIGITDSILNTSIRFTWSDTICSGTCPNSIQSYTYKLVQVSTGDEIDSGTSSADERMVIITGLTPCAVYTFEVTGVTVGDTGTYYGAKSVAAGGKEPGQIYDLEVIASFTGGFIANWQSLTSPCSADNYTIGYKLIKRDQCDQIEEEPRVTGPTVTDTNVTIGVNNQVVLHSTYQVYVWASNIYGEGPEISQEVTTLPGAVPGAAPSDVRVTSTNLDSLSFSWDEVPCGRRHRNITQYAYQLFDGNDAFVAGYVTSNRQITIGSVLLQCSTYKFQVGAVGEGGTVGPYSESVTAMTSTSVTNLNAEPISSTELEVSWDTPSTASCTTDVDYEVEYRLTNRGQCQPLDDNAAMSELVSGATVTLTGLHPYSTYTIRVRASGGVATLYSMTSEAAPSGHPADVNVMRTTNTTIVITWDKPLCAERNGNITWYTYSLLETENSSYIVQDMETTDTRVLLTDLAPSTSYIFNVSANTNGGKGPSLFVDITTQGAEIASTTAAFNVALLVGIVIVVVVVVVIIMIIAILLLVVKRQQNQQNELVGIELHGTKQQIDDDVTIGSPAFVADDQTEGYDDTKGTTTQTDDEVNIGNPAFDADDENEGYDDTLNDTNCQTDDGVSTGYLSFDADDQNEGYDDVDLDYHQYESDITSKWEIAWKDLTLTGKILGKGNFGEVQLGRVWIRDKWVKAAVKTLKESTPESERALFKEEFDTMTKIGHHPNVVNILGSCDHAGTLYVVLEFVPHDNMRKFLRKSRKDVSASEKKATAVSNLTPEQLLKFATGVAKAMTHIASCGVIHRDLAARNILVGRGLTAKVADFGMSRGQNEYVQTSSQRVPTRWLSIESMTRKTYSTKSDVWSFGILLWEIATFGGTPYPGIDTKQLTYHLISGYRMPKPDNCDDEMYELMMKCWLEDPEDRPSFADIVDILTDMTSEEKIYISSHYLTFEFAEINLDRDDK